jgi:hypothetical protein
MMAPELAMLSMIRFKATGRALRAQRRGAFGGVATVASTVAALLLTACATPPPAPGTDRETVVRTWGTPTARYTLDGGAERLEYASGPYGRTTWMIDLDASGRVRAVEQVLDEARFAVFAERAPGLATDDVRRALGTPGERQRVRYPDGELWSWRYPTNDCLWFQVQFGPDGRAVNAGYNIDPRCDARSDARD